MIGAHYTTEPEYLALLDRVRADPTDETARRVMADWVQDHDDEAEAAAIRGGRSLWVDLLPVLDRACARLAQTAATMVAEFGDVLPEIARLLARSAEELRATIAALTPAPADRDPGAAADGTRPGGEKGDTAAD